MSAHKSTISYLFAVFLTCTTYSSSPAQWQHVPTPSPKFTIMDINFISNNDGFAVGTNLGCIKTTDGGMSWSLQHSGGSAHFVKTRFFDEQHGIAIGQHIYPGGPYESYLYVTADGGQHWNVSYTRTGCEYITDFSFTSQKYGWASVQLICGDINHGSCIVKSIDSGKTWSELYDPLIAEPEAIIALDDKTAIVTCKDIPNFNTYIIKTTDAGLTWHRVYDAGDIPISDYKQLSDSCLVAGEWRGTIVKSTDAGSTWSTLSLPTNVILNKIAVHSLNEYYAMGNYDTNTAIYRTTNNGNEWTMIYNETFLAYGLVSKPNGELLMAGDTGGVYRNTFTEGVVPQNNITIRGYRLFENYPNPFNPSTNITYSIPKNSNVSLVVYDLLGREITRLIQGTKLRGEYSVSWNAANVPSGVYYYRLVAGSFVETKKMVVMK